MTPELLVAAGGVSALLGAVVMLFKLGSVNARDTTAQRGGWRDLRDEERKLRVEAEAKLERCEEERDRLRTLRARR